jgi:hypothetical protein
MRVVEVEHVRGDAVEQCGAQPIQFNRPREASCTTSRGRSAGRELTTKRAKVRVTWAVSADVLGAVFMCVSVAPRGSLDFGAGHLDQLAPFRHLVLDVGANFGA